MQKWSCRNPLTIEERKIIESGIKEGLSSRQIGSLINRGKSVILRESKRLGDLENYDAVNAQKKFEKIQRLSWKKISATLKSKKNHVGP